MLLWPLAGMVKCLLISCEHQYKHGIEDLECDDPVWNTL